MSFSDLIKKDNNGKKIIKIEEEIEFFKQE